MTTPLPSAGLGVRWLCRFASVTMRSRGACLSVVWFLTATAWNSALPGGILQIKDGYFWDPLTTNYFIPRGFGYQTFNPPVGASQSFEQLRYDLTEFKKLNANSVRVEFVWNTVEPAPGVFDWSKPDFLVSQARALGLRLFVLIGFQYAPGWFPTDWRAINDNLGATNAADRLSVVLNYEHPGPRLAYSNYIFQVTRRYRDHPEIAAWILGNEYAYFDLWNPDHRYLGFDPISQASYRRFLAERYVGDIELLNATWTSNYTSFAEIPMFAEYPADRRNAGYHDLILWREHSIGEYVALGAAAASLADPMHLRTYSMIGSLFIGNDGNYTCENARTIVDACRRRGAPLHFWAINNYAWATFTGDLRSTDFGTAKHLADSGLPVLVTETGHSTTDDLLLGAPPRQPKAVAAAMWESLMSGAIGAHIFTWNDRNLFNGVFIRERGFGLVHESRMPKPAYTTVEAMFRQMQAARLEQLLPGSRRARADVALFWPQEAAMGWPRANQENAMLWGALRRLGYQLEVLRDDAFDQDGFTNASALLLSRCGQMRTDQLERVLTRAIPKGIHVHANADLPGQFNAYGQTNAYWPERIQSLFGLEIARAQSAWDSGATHTSYTRLATRVARTLGPLTAGETDAVLTWKVWHGVRPVSGTTLVTHRGVNGSQPETPALQLLDLGPAKTALNTFALGDLSYQPWLPPFHDWDVRHDWLRAIYREHFGVRPAIEVSGPGSSYVMVDHRRCANGSVLVSLLNQHTNRAVIHLSSPALLNGRTVENLSTGEIVTRSSDGMLPIEMDGDDFICLYVYDPENAATGSLLQPGRNKLWIHNSPAIVWACGTNCILTLAYDVPDPGFSLHASLERVGSPNLVYADANGGPVAGKGTRTLALRVPDPDLNDPWYASSLAGAEYMFRAWLQRDGLAESEALMPVRLVWPVRPATVPDAVKPGESYEIVVRWEELPSWLGTEMGLPLDRRRLWQPYAASEQYYRVGLELQAAGQPVAREECLTIEGTGQYAFTLAVPEGATGPFSWRSYVETAPGVAIDMLDSFEDRDTGDVPDYFSPWKLFLYAENPSAVPAMFYAAGVHSAAIDGDKAVFTVITNPPAAGNFSGSFLSYSYPTNWALPPNREAWSDYTFGFRFREAVGLRCILEMQLKDAHGGQIHFTKAYLPGPNGWDAIQARLADFVSPPWVGRFDPTCVRELILNIQMQDQAATYVGSIDDVRFTGPKAPPSLRGPQDLWETFDARPVGTGAAGITALAPWLAYVYPGPNERLLDVGIAAAKGVADGHAAFLTVTNPPGIGDIAGFGLYRPFASTWALPADVAEWTNYFLAFSFREEHGHPCDVEIQLKSGIDRWIEYKRSYRPGLDGWDHVRAPLAEFLPPDGISPFDPMAVQGIAFNIRTPDSETLYIAYIDDPHFESPLVGVRTGVLLGSYESANDSPPRDLHFAVEAVRLPQGGTALTWHARRELVYSVEYQDNEPLVEWRFTDLPPFTQLRFDTDGPATVMDPGLLQAGGGRFYRIRAQPR